jgi:flagellar biosynthesis/type III secretory pathway protein FliH
VTPLRDARILKKEAVAQAEKTVLPGLLIAPNAKKRVAREVVDAHLLARRLLDEARREADAILAHARESAKRVAAGAAEEAREEEHAKVASLYLALRVEDERRQERDLDRAIGLARVLAERLLGEELAADPTRIVALARQALAEARGATRAAIEASPLDADALRNHLVDLGLAQGLASSALEVKIDPQLSRGSLRVHTNLGTLDVQLTPQLERLAEALRDALT